MWESVIPQRPVSVKRTHGFPIRPAMKGPFRTKGARLADHLPTWPSRSGGFDPNLDFSLMSNLIATRAFASGGLNQIS